MKQLKWIACPKCGDIIGPYNKGVEEQRKKKKFLTWCNDCKTGVTPLYL